MRERNSFMLLNVSGLRATLLKPPPQERIQMGSWDSVEPAFDS